MPIRRALVAVAAVCVVAVVMAASPAAAAGPTIIRGPKHVVASVDLADRCQGFDVRLDYTATQNVQIVFPSGQFITAGSFKGSVTRIEPDGSDGPRISFNFSGAGRFDFANDVATAWGPWELDSPDDPTTQQWEGQLYLVRGRTVWSPSTVTILSSTTPIRNLCTELAAA
jgi:hypothetical protein